MSHIAARLRSMFSYIRLIGYLLRSFANLFYGIWKIAKLKNAPITIFGGARLKADSIYMKQAAELANKLAMHGIPVLTGGGPGIMEAATCGIAKNKKAIVSTIGIRVRGLDNDKVMSACHKNVIEMNSFSARKWLLIHYSVGFAVFPGGIGTLDELAELLTLIQTKMRPRAPIVLIGVEYWKPFMEWLEESALKNGLIAKEDITLFTITDDIQKAYDLLVEQSPKPFTLFE